ncbi:acyl-CoA synthetase [[Mycobacterium] vasticus]|uniref:Acyl-CoA synthetase n=1 Tax=[Mycobacterium] vasticus TaxID=2875777 RepID=A0ABU5Z245_9MYCO|nr:acyl-CoA synthetase [Mycolicibacter sp. MYC017]MEB3070694.1 acyl-CoA synthetase [Mycolicibacter sp. MYC017]
MTRTKPTDDGPERHKLDEDDHDLLTFGEAGERLRLEVQAAATRVTELEGGAGREAELTEAQARLSALRDAAKRNTAQPINDANFEKFFGYPGKAKRNLPAPDKT